MNVVCGLRASSVAECWPSIHKALSSITSTAKRIVWTWVPSLRRLIGYRYLKSKKGGCGGTNNSDMYQQTTDVIPGLCPHPSPS